MKELLCQQTGGNAKITDLHELDPDGVQAVRIGPTDQRYIAICPIHPLVNDSRPPILPTITDGKVTGCIELPFDPQEA